METCEELKQEGNQAFRKDDYAEAAEKYSKALEQLQSVEQVTSITARAKATLLTNRSACFARMHQWDQSLKDADKARIVDLKYAKAWLRAGEAAQELGHTEKAFSYFISLCELQLSDGADTLGQNDPVLEKCAYEMSNLAFKTFLSISNANTFVNDNDLISWWQKPELLVQNSKKYIQESANKSDATAEVINRYAHLFSRLSNYSLWDLTKLMHLSHLGHIFRVVGDADKAKICYFIIICHCQSEPMLKVAVLHNLALLYFSAFNHTKALGAAKILLKLYEEEKLQVPLEIKCLIGQLYLINGELLKAEIILEDTLSVAQKDNTDEALLGKICYVLGSVQCQLGNASKGVYYFQQALRLYEKLKCIQKAAECCYMLAQNSVDYNEALEYINRSMQLDQMNEQNVRLQYFLGDVHRKAGEIEKAYNCYTKALALQEEKDSKNPLLMYEILIRLAKVYGYLHKHREAEECVMKAFCIDQEYQPFPAAYSIKYSALLEILQDNFPKAIELLEEVEMLLRNEWGKMRRDKHRVFWGSNVLGPSNFYFLLQFCLVQSGKEMEALEKAEEGRSQALLEHRFTLSQKVKSDFTRAHMMECAAQLQATILVFTVFRMQSWLPPFIFAWVVSGDKIDFKMITFQKPIGNTNSASPVEELLDDACLPILSVRSESHQNLRKIGHISAKFKELDGDKTRLCYDQLIAPIEDLLPNNTSRLIIVPQEVLYQIPFCTLLDNHGQRLVEKYELLLTPSIQLLNILSSEISGHKELQAAVIADPAFPKTMFTSMPYLPAARKEGIAIGNLLNANTLFHDQATKQEVLQTLRTASLVHIAAHALQDISRNSEHYLPGAIVLAAPKEGGESRNDVDALDNCLLYSEEIQKEDLSHVKLAVLSCCESGGGKINTEGILGLSRAFLYAGAQSVLVCIWPIRDNEDTIQFMTIFYQYYLNGQSASSALRAAQLQCMKDGICLRDWSGYFVLGGMDKT